MTDFVVGEGRKMRVVSAKQVKIDNNFLRKKAVLAENLEAGDWL